MVTSHFLKVQVKPQVFEGKVWIKSQVFCHESKSSLNSLLPSDLSTCWETRIWKRAERLKIVSVYTNRQIYCRTHCRKCVATTYSLIFCYLTHPSSPRAWLNINLSLSHHMDTTLCDG